MKVLFTLLATTTALASAHESNTMSCVMNASLNHDLFPDKVNATKSEFWDIQYFNTYKIIRNEISDKSYVLYQCGTQLPSSVSNYTAAIPVPLQSGAGVTSTTFIPFFELLGIRTEMKAYFGEEGSISSPCLKQLIADGHTRVVTNSSDPTTASELQGLVGFSNGFTDLSLYTNVVVDEYQESSNEAVFEWIKFISAFFNLEAKANALFNEVGQSYSCVANNAASVTADKAKPTVVWASYANFSGTEGFDVGECPNFYCELADRCSATLLSSREGSIDYFGGKIMTIDEFVAFAKDAEHWIFPGFNWDTVYPLYKTQLDTIVSVQNKQVFDVQAGGPNAWFEQRIAEPGTYNSVRTFS